MTNLVAFIVGVLAFPLCVWLGVAIIDRIEK